MIDQEFIPYEQALALKELGFNEDCLATRFTDNWLSSGTTGLVDIMIRKHPESVKTPLYQQAFRWFRDKYDIDIQITQHWVGSDDKEYGFSISYLPEEFKQAKRPASHIVRIESYRELVGSYMGAWTEHNQAESECLKILIGIVREEISDGTICYLTKPNRHEIPLSTNNLENNPIK